MLFRSASFLFTADTQEFHEEHFSTARFLGEVRSHNPSIQFHLIAGDLVHWGIGKEWRAFRKVATAEYSATLPIVPVLNGHGHIYQRLRVDGVNYVIAGPAAGSFGEVYSKPLQSELTLPNERTVSLVTVDRERCIRRQTWSVKSEKLLEDVSL